VSTRFHHFGISGLCYYKNLKVFKPVIMVNIEDSLWQDHGESSINF
jgi:hypothetical protein